MYFETFFDSNRDLVSVDQYGYIDLKKANATSTVDVDINIQEESFNRIDDPRSIGDRPSDEFEIQQANKTIVDYQPPKDEATS